MHYFEVIFLILVLFCVIKMFLLFICIVCVMIWVLHRVRYTFMFQTPPKYPGWLPVLGHLHLIIRLDQKMIWDFYKKLSYETRRNGGVLTFSLGPENRYFVTDPDDASLIAATCMEKDAAYNIARPWLGNGLLTADVPTWKAHRKIMNLAFTQQVLVGLLPVFNSQSRQLLRRFDKHIGQPFKPEPVLLITNLETICKTSAGVDSQNKALFDQYVTSLRDIFECMYERFLKYWLHSQTIFQFSTLKKRQDKVVDGLHTLSHMVLQERKSKIQALKEQQSSTETFRPLMDTIIELSLDKGVMTDKEMREHLDTIIFGGHDTTATSLTYTLMLLGSDPVRQEKVYKEIMEVMGDSDRDVDKDDIPKLVYTESVIKESLRLYPIAPCFPRVTATNLKLKNYTVATGKTCIIDSWSILRHHIWGADAEEFRPERWLEPHTLPNVQKIYGAFGVGKRNCIGKPYAMMAMKVMLVYLLRRYKVTADINKLTLKMDSLLRPQSGDEITIQLRK